MTHYDANSNKTGGIDTKPAAVQTTSGDVIEATHHIINDEAGLAHLYLADRSDGIDISIPLSQVEAVARSDRGREALDIPVAERELVTDGGRDVPQCDGSDEAEQMRIDDFGGRRLMTDGGEPESPRTIWTEDDRYDECPWDNECANPLCDYPISDSDDFCNLHCGERVRAARALIERSESPESIIDEYWEVSLDEARTVARTLRPGADIEPHPSEYEDEGPVCWGCDRELVYADDDATYCHDCLYRTVFDPEELGIGWCGRDGCDRRTQPDADYCQAEYCDSDEVVNDDDDDEKPLMTDGGEPLDDDDVDTDFSGVNIEGAEDDDEVIVPGGGDDGEGIEEMSDDEADRMRADALAASAAAVDDMDDDDDDGEDGYVRNGDGLRVATGRGLDDMASPGDDGKYSCVLCGAATDTEHGAKSHFGRSHKDATAIDVEQAIVMNDDDEVIVPDADDDGDGDDGEGDEDMPEAWRDASNAYVNARVQSSPVTRADARDAVVEALMSECDWMSIVERCEPGKHYDLWRWDDDDGWVDDADAYISERTAEHLKSTASDTEIGHYKSQLARRNYVSQDTVNGKTRDETLIPVGNGVVNVDDIEYDAETRTIDTESVELEDMRKENRFTYRIQTDWDPDGADVEGVDDWISDVIHTESERRVLWEFVGHALHPRYPVDGFAVLLGRGGSGKSQTLEVVKTMLGGENVSVRTLKQIETNNFAAGKPVPEMRANINTELNGEQLKSMSTLKTYAAGEETEIEPKGEPAYKGVVDATMMFASDDPPRFPSGNRATRRRVYPIEFPAIYTDDADTDDPLQLESEGKLVVQERLQADARLQAVLMKGVAGLKRLLEEGDFTDDRTGDERIAKYENYSDPSQDFARHALVADPDGQGIETGDLKATFDAFADSHDHAGKTIGQIIDVLEEMPEYPVVRTQTRTFSDRKEKEVVYEGIGFTEAALDVWVPESSRDVYRDDAVDGEDGRALETLKDIRQDSSLGRRDAVKVTVNTSSSDTSYNRHEEGVLRDGTDTMRYYVPHSGLSLEKDETYVIEQAVAVEENDDTKLQLVSGMTDPTKIVRGDEDGQDSLDDDEDDDGEGMSQDERVSALRNVISAETMRDDGDGASVDRVVEAAESRGIEATDVRDELDALKRSGKVYAPQDGRIRLTSGGD